MHHRFRSGGGLVAGVLAEAGRTVFVIEEGPHVPGSKMTQRESEMYPLLYRDGGNQMTKDGGINVLQGRALGGSTVINTADLVGVPDQVLAHWATHFGCDRYDLATVRAAENICLEAIGANPISEAQFNRNNRLLLEGGRKLGMDGGAFVHNRIIH